MKYHSQEGPDGGPVLSILILDSFDAISVKSGHFFEDEAVSEFRVEYFRRLAQCGMKSLDIFVQ